MANLELLRGQAEAFCRQRNCERAIAALEGLTVEAPDAPEVRYQLGVCFSGICQSHSLADSEIALEYFRSALARCGPDSSALLRSRILGALGNSYLNSSRLPREAGLAAAIECYEQAAALCQALGEPEGWAREQNNLGLAKCELAVTEPQRWREAVEHFRRSLAVRAQLSDREGYAATLENLGAAYRMLPGGDRRANTLRSVECYCRALRIYRPAQYPLANAAVHNNLGNAYLSIPAGSAWEKHRHVRRALRHFEQALRIRTRDRYPGDYAVTQFNRGQAFLQWRALDPRESLQAAAECFEEAAAAFEQAGRREQAREARHMLQLVREGLPKAA